MTIFFSLGYKQAIFANLGVETLLAFESVCTISTKLVAYMLLHRIQNWNVLFL